MTKAVVQAVFTNYRRIRSRKVMELCFEVPIETWATAYKVLGEPEIETAQWFAVARMNGAVEPAPTPEKQGSNLAANAAIMCEEPTFQRFLHERVGATYDVNDSNRLWTNTVLKLQLQIKSKSELNTDPAAAARWRDLRSEFEAWKLT